MQAKIIVQNQEEAVLIARILNNAAMDAQYNDALRNGIRGDSAANILYQLRDAVTLEEANNA
ncbi:MAG: hypothetical protein FWB85_02690 [Chitinispirillia bacterium]|nr:hypothetical protein [Chitinispirillia bacterium]MCL2241331.1 hypothetical protein [Chitinispirillia bacterium]